MPRRSASSTQRSRNRREPGVPWCATTGTPAGSPASSTRSSRPPGPAIVCSRVGTPESMPAGDMVARTTMRLDGIHHITAITSDAQRNVDFYVGVLGLRLVKKTVNQDNPTVYHLFYADEKGDPGSDLTFFEYPGIPIGRAGDGMVHRIVWRVGSADALDFWGARLGERGVEVHRGQRRPRG